MNICRREWTKKSNMNSLLLQWNATAKLADKFIRRGYSQFAPYSILFSASSPLPPLLFPLSTFIFYLLFSVARCVHFCSLLLASIIAKYLGRFLFYPTNYEHRYELRTALFPTTNNSNSNKNNISWNKNKRQEQPFHHFFLSARY